MKIIHYICLVVAFTASVAATAQSTKKGTKAANKAVSKTTAKGNSQTTPTNNNATIKRVVSDSEYSYAKGVTHTEGLGYYLQSQYNVYDDQMAPNIAGIKAYYNAPSNQKLALVAEAEAITNGIGALTQQFPRFNQIITGEQGKAYIDTTAFLNGFVDLSKGKARYTPEQARQILAQQDQYLRLQKAKVAYDEMQANLAANKDLKTLEGGVQYRILVKGKGKQPTATSSVKVNYEGRLTNGTIFDSSYKRGEPIVFKANQVIKGWTTALQAMPVGSTWEVFIPQELAYGERGAGQDIPPYANLIFKIELISIEAE